jgi:hypothetical protein
MLGGRIGGGKTNQLLSDITTSVIAEKATEHLVAMQQEDVRTGEEDQDDDLEQLRQKRMAELKNSRKEQIENVTVRGHGQYTEITQDEFLPAVTASRQVICHFYHQDFQRCKIIDKHLQLLARSHVETRFVFINAEKAPFFVERLNVRTLPTILFFRDGINFERVLGFDGISNKDNFPTAALAKRLARSGMITPKNQDESGSDSDDN